MSEESAFLATLEASPNDATTRLVYADWLDERDRHIDAALQRVLACPDDDGLRLRHADAVEGTDAAWAEFVRVQVELARMPPEPIPIVGMENRPILKEVAHYLRKNTDPHYERRERLRRREREHLTSPGIQAWFSLPGLHYNWFAIPSAHTAGGVSPADGWTIAPNSPSPLLNQREVWGWNDGRGRIIEAIPRRGFIESVTCTAADWFQHAPAIRAAQPVRKVKLTTWWADNMLAECYPGIEFELPTALVTVTIGDEPVVGHWAT